MTETSKPSSTEPDKPELERLAAEATADPAADGIASPEPGPAATAPTATAPPPTAATRGRGRPVGSTSKKKHVGAPTSPPKEPVPIIHPDIVRGAIKAPYAVAASLYGDHWALSDEEADSMVPAHLAVAEQYLPQAVGKHAALYTIALLHLMTIFGRTTIHMRLKEEQDKLRRESIAQIQRPPKPTGKDGKKGEAIPAMPEHLADRSIPIADVLRPQVRPGPKERPPGT